MMKRISALRRWLASALALCLCVSQAACAQETPELLEPVGVKLDTFEACIGDISTMAVYDASVIPHVEELFFTQEGVVDEIHAVIGQQVKAGDLLLTLDQEAELEQMETLTEQIDALESDAVYAEKLAAIDLAILEVELRALQSQSPADAEAIALKKLDIEERKLDMELETSLRDMQLNELRSKLEALENEVSKNALYAPFDGRIIHAEKLDRGTYISAYTPVLFLADDSRLSIESAFISSVTLSNAHDLYALIGAGRYDVTPVEVDPQEQIAMALSGETVMTEFSFDGPHPDVSSGMYAAVFVVGRHVENALLVPTNALYHDSNGRYLYVIENGARVRRDVKAGISNDSLTQIIEGLEEGALVYVKD